MVITMTSNIICSTAAPTTTNTITTTTTTTTTATATIQECYEQPLHEEDLEKLINQYDKDGTGSPTL